MSAQALNHGSHHVNHHDRSIQLARLILRRLFKKHLGAFTVKLWDNSVLQIGRGISAFTLNIRSPVVSAGVLGRTALQRLRAWYYA